MAVNMAVCPSIYLSVYPFICVCPRQTSVLSKQLNIGKQHSMVDWGLDAKDHGEIRVGNIYKF